MEEYYDCFSNSKGMFYVVTKGRTCAEAGETSSVLQAKVMGFYL